MNHYTLDPRHLINPALIQRVQDQYAVKAGFVDPAAMAGGGAGGGMPVDASAAGGAPPMDPGGMSGMGGMGGGGGGMEAKLDKMMQLMSMGGMGGGAGGAGGPLKPKIDVNVALMQISKMLARIADALGVQIPAHEMIATPQDLTAMASQQQTGAPGTPLQDGGQGGAGGGEAGGAPQGAIPPIDPMGGIGGQKQGQYRPYVSNGESFGGKDPYAGLIRNHDLAAAILTTMGRA